MGKSYKVKYTKEYISLFNEIFKAGNNKYVNKDYLTNEQIKVISKIVSQDK